MSLVPVSAHEQLQKWDGFVNDPRGRVATGFADFDALLRRGGFAPGDFIIFGGRTHTRKTTVLLNLVVNALQQGVAVGLVGLDESFPQYVGKLLSALTGKSVESVEELWLTDREQYEELYLQVCDKLVMAEGVRPTTEDLTYWRQNADPEPSLVFIDYSSLLFRNKFDGQEVQRVSRLIEELQQWTKYEDITTVALHQTGRMDEGSGQRYHGDTPMSLASLKYGGEEYADIVMCTYRPALEPFGNMNYDQARQYRGDRWDEEEWKEAKRIVDKNRNSTYLQLVKNRPGTRLNEQGVELVSVGDSMKVVQAA